MWLFESWMVGPQRANRKKIEKKNNQLQSPVKFLSDTIRFVTALIREPTLNWCSQVAALIFYSLKLKNIKNLSSWIRIWALSFNCHINLDTRNKSEIKRSHEFERERGCVTWESWGWQWKGNDTIVISKKIKSWGRISIFSVSLGFSTWNEPRASYMLGLHSTVELGPMPLCSVYFFNYKKGLPKLTWLALFLLCSCFFLCE